MVCRQKLRAFTGRDANGKRSYIDQTVHDTRKQADQALRKFWRSGAPAV